MRAGVVELDDAAGVDVREQPFVLGQPAGHALAHPGLAQRQIEGRRAHAEPGHPVVAIGGAVDVVGVARHVGDHAFDGAGFGAGEPVAMDAARPGFGEQEREAVVGHADAVRIAVGVEHGAGPAGARIVDQQAAGRAALDRIERPVVGVVAGRGIGEEDPAVGGDVAVVGVAQARIVDDRAPGAVGLGRQPGHLAGPRNGVEAHGADADLEGAVAIEGEAEREAAGMGEDLGAPVVGGEEADDLAVAGAAVEVVVVVEDDVLGALELAEADRLCGRQPVVERVGRSESGSADWRAHAVVDRRDIDLVQHLGAVLEPADVEDHGEPPA